MSSALRVVGNGGSLLLCPTANGKAPTAPPDIAERKTTVYKNKPSETLAGRFRGLSVYSVPIVFSLIMVCSTITIMTCAERFLSVPVGYGYTD